jgi:hypothetical protein
MKTQEYDELAMVGKGIGRQISKTKLKSNEIDDQTVYFGLTICRFVEKLDCFHVARACPC